MAQILRRGLAVFIVVVSLQGGMATAATAQQQHLSADTASTKTCSAGYVHANLSWGEKCLRAGQFCKIGNAQYHHYGFTCLATGHLRRTSTVSSSTKPPASTHPAGVTAKCNDGTYSYSLHHSGTCSHHGGVAIFYS